MVDTEFEIGVRHGEFVGEILIGLVFIAGGGSVIGGTVAAYKTATTTFKAVNFVAKTYKRVSSSPAELFSDAIEASFNAY